MELKRIELNRDNENIFTIEEDFGNELVTIYIKQIDENNEIKETQRSFSQRDFDFLRQSLRIISEDWDFFNRNVE
jgi:hypothetical protein